MCLNYFSMVKMEEVYDDDDTMSASEVWNLLVEYIGECLDMDTLQVYRCTCVAGVFLNSVTMGVILPLCRTSDTLKDYYYTCLTGWAGSIVAAQQL